MNAMVSACNVVLAITLSLNHLMFENSTPIRKPSTDNFHHPQVSGSRQGWSRDSQNAALLGYMSPL